MICKYINITGKKSDEIESIMEKMTDLGRNGCDLEKYFNCVLEYWQLKYETIIEKYKAIFHY